MKNKKMIVFVSSLIAFALVITLITIIISQSNKQTEKVESSNGEENITKKHNNSSDTEKQNNITYSDQDNSSLLYGKGDDTLDYYDDALDTGEDTHDDNIPTIFDEGQDFKQKIGFHIGTPEILKGSSIPFNFGETILAKDGYVAILVEGKMLYYSPSTNETKQIAENVTNAKRSDDGDYLIFEEKVGNEFITYYFSFPISEDGKVKIMSTMNALKDFGVINNTFYFSSQDDENNSYYYSPFDTSRDSNELDYFAVLSTFGTTTNKKEFITYNEENQTFYTFEGRGKNKEKIFSISNESEKYIRILEVNPYRADRVILTGFSRDSNYPYSEKVYLNSKLLPNLQDIKKIAWVNENGFFYTDLSYENLLYYYDLKGKENFVLDSSVTSFSYDEDEKILYYVKQDNKIRKISISAS